MTDRLSASALDSKDERAECWLSAAGAARGVKVGAVTRREEVETERRERPAARTGVDSTDERREGVVD